MKKMLLNLSLIALILLMMYCGPSAEEKKRARLAQESKEQPNELKYTTVVIFEGCQYLKTEIDEGNCDYNHYVLLHKGDCNNEIHINKSN